MERDVEIDILKGFGIFAVVTGHIVSGLASEIIFLFHMPLFFIVSGYLFKADPNHNRLLKKKAVSLLTPYFVYLCIFKAPELGRFAIEWIANPSFNNAYDFINSMFWSIWGGRKLTGTLGVFWFVSCLYLTIQIYNYFLNRFNSINSILYLAGLFYIVAVINQYVFEWIAFPWGINVALCSFLFFCVGHIFGEKMFNHQSLIVIVTSVLITLGSMGLVYVGYNLSFNMKYTNYGWFILSPIAAIAITSLIYTFSCLIQHFYLNDLFIYSGKASITVMFVHQFLHFRLVEYCNEYPWLMSLLILFSCLLFHRLLTLSAITRFFFLGSYKDYKLLTSKFSGR